MRTFFDGSAEAAALALLELDRRRVDESEIEGLRQRLDEVDFSEGAGR